MRQPAYFKGLDTVQTYKSPSGSESAGALLARFYGAEIGTGMGNAIAAAMGVIVGPPRPANVPERTTAESAAGV